MTLSYINSRTINHVVIYSYTLLYGFNQLLTNPIHLCLLHHKNVLTLSLILELVLLDDFLLIHADMNASKNILLLLQCEKQGKRRPTCFREQKE